jgi:NAD(P)-dependent dehydrogenase (short-subunit alcohol dehydrogenase family)
VEIETLVRRGSQRSPWPLMFAAAGLYAGYAAMAALRIKPPDESRESFRDAVALITGGARGLGFAMAKVLAAEGAHLVLLSRTEEELQRAARRLREEFGVRVFPVVCDVRNEAAVVRAVNAIVGEMGRLDVLINNAGVIQVMPYAHAQPEDFRDSLDTHFWGPYYLTRACLPHLARRRGRIVNVSSIGGRISVPHLMPYGVGKFALVGFSEGLRAELQRDGVSVTTVTPHLMQAGSHRNALVRGRHALEATWFALGTASRLTALDANDVARTIVEAARARRACVTPGWQARLAILLNAVAPEMVATLAAIAVTVLPSKTDSATGDVGRLSRDVRIGFPARFFPTESARDLNQPIAPDEAGAVTV